MIQKGESMEIQFSFDLDQAQRDCILNSTFYLKWLNNLQDGIDISSIEFQSVDFIYRNGIPRPLFIKFIVDAKDVEGHKLPGIVLLRGPAVCILPVLYTEDEPYVVLVRQARLGPGKLGNLEIPAGILDVDVSLKELAAKELKEETGLDVELHQLKDLLNDFGSVHSRLYTSVGISDESLAFYLYERSMEPGDIELLQGAIRQNEHENEFIRVEMMPISAAKAHLEDSKSLLAILMYESLKWSQR